MPARWLAIAAVLALSSMGCSLIYGDESKYNPTCDSDDDCAVLNPLFACGDEGRCVSCDGDGDGWPGPRTECGELVNRSFGAEVDCADGDPTRSPGLPPICGTMVEESCNTAQFRALEMLAAGDDDGRRFEAGPLPPRLLWERGDRVFSFDVGAYPVSGAAEDPDLAVIVGYGPEGEGEARLFDVDVDRDDFSREIDPSIIPSPDPGFSPITDVVEVVMRTVVVIPPAPPGMQMQMFGVGAAIVGQDAAMQWRISGGSVDPSEAGPMYTPFVSIPRPGQIARGAAIVETFVPIDEMIAAAAPGAAWRESGGTLVRNTIELIPGSTTMAAVSSPDVPAEPTDVGALHGTLATLLIGDDAAGTGIFWWDLFPDMKGRPAVVGHATLAMPRTGRLAVGYIGPDPPDAAEIGAFLIAYPVDRNVIYQVLSCDGYLSESCTLDPTPIVVEVGVPVDQFDMDFFAVAMIEQRPDERQGVAIRMINPGGGMGGALDIRVPVLDSDRVHGRIEDLRMSLSYDDDAGLNLVVAVLVRPDDDPNAFEIWSAGARLCGGNPDMMIDGGVGDGGGPPMDGGMSDAGPPPDIGPPPEGGVPTDCAMYCTLVYEGACSTQYNSYQHCIDACAAFDLGTPGMVGANTRACRFEYAARGECHAAGPHGDDLCGTHCEAYCSLLRAGCEMRFETVYGTGTEAIEACLAACAPLANPGFYDTSMATGNDVNCRITHAINGAVTPSMAECNSAFGEAGSDCPGS
jgi:hypothetical protein